MSTVRTSAITERAEVTADPPRLLRTTRQKLYLLIGIILMIIFLAAAGEDWLTIVNYTLIAAIATLALNVLSGYTGQVSLGLAFFMAIGAYTAALLGGTPPTTSHDPAGLGLSFLIWLPAAGIVAALVGAIIGPSALRLRGFYLGIVTLSLIFIGHYLFTNLSSITGGPQGRSFPAPAFGDFSFSQQNDLFAGQAITPGQQYFILLIIVLTLSALFVGNVMRSRAGRAFRAVRDNEVGAAIMGVNLFEAKMGAFMLSSFLAGIAGALLASYSSYVVPGYWDLTLSIQFVAAIIVGGIASVWGSILGAAFVFALPRLIDQFSLLPPSSTSGGLTSGDLNAIIYGVLIILFLLFEPGGIMGLIRRIRDIRGIQALARTRNARNREGGELAEVTDLSSSEAHSKLEVEHSTLPEGEGM